MDCWYLKPLSPFSEGKSADVLLQDISSLPADRPLRALPIGILEF